MCNINKRLIAAVDRLHIDRTLTFNRIESIYLQWEVLRYKVQKQLTFKNNKLISLIQYKRRKIDTFYNYIINYNIC